MPPPPIRSPSRYFSVAPPPPIPASLAGSAVSWPTRTPLSTGTDISESAVLLDDDAVASAGDQLERELRARGIVAGDRVAILCGTRAEMVAAREAVAALEATLVPLDPR